MKDVYTFEENSEPEKTMSDFVTGEETKTSSTKSTVIDPLIAAKKRNIKCGLINTAISVGLNSIPIIVNVVKNKKQGVPNKVNRVDIIRLAVSTAFPILETVDSAFLDNKLTDKYHLKDVRNLTNIAMTYPAAHQALNDFVNKSINKQENAENGTLIQQEKNTAMPMMILGIGNIVTPYITNKFTDENLTFIQKLNSAIPIPFLGRIVRTVAHKNPALENIYQTGASIINVAQSSSRMLGNAVRSKPNSTLNKATSTVANIADTVGDILGVQRVGGGMYGNYGGYNYNNYGSRWTNGGYYGNTNW